MLAQKPSLVVRLRTEDDVDACVEILKSVHSLDGYPVEGAAMARAWIASDAADLKAWVAELDGHIVGHAIVSRDQEGNAAADIWRNKHPDKAVAVLQRLFVSPAARKAGVGRKLIATAMSYSVQNDLQLVLNVMVKDTAAIRLYERMGWSCIVSATHHFGERQQMDAVCYAALANPSRNPTPQA
ncbi:hypothetical protein LTS18_011897 [Coniosporium uncinatum]|uniref:Uncharacterized protein n=1 Tax=Coniosporium uncinatum TaxID=93489 RepID=A0ACC3DCW3_9PEZI|nr:hypothetical protein LTS18_011897 [Coniosporium uncinatum]